MANPHIKTAVLIFDSFQNESGIGKSFLASSYLSEALTSHIKKQVQHTGLPYFHIKEDNQKGETFGDRFSNAIASVYDKGYDAVITVGNDVPNLTSAHIVKAKEGLSKNRFTIGPSFDGGFYLMALQKADFDREKFNAFSWNSSKVSQELLAYIRSVKKREIVQLEYLHDVDRLYDLKKVYSTLKISQKNLRVIIQQHIQFFVDIFKEPKLRYFTLSLFTPLNKGSPIFH